MKLSFEEEVLEYIVDKALEYKLGARGLRSICERIMTEVMYEVPIQAQEGLTEYTVALDYAKVRVETAGFAAA